MAKWDWEVRCEDEIINPSTFAAALRAVQRMVNARGGRCYISPAHKRQLPKTGCAKLVYDVKAPFTRKKSLMPDEILCQIELHRSPTLRLQ